MHHRQLVNVMICGLAVACFTYGQAGGSITGAVTDLAGNPVAKAEIRATNTATKAVFKATTSAQGDYVLERLPAGAYNLSSITAGFVPFQQQGVVVAAGKVVTANLRLQDVQLNTLGDGRDFFADSSFGYARPAPTGPTPRLPDGKPDFSGVWSPQRTIDPGKPELTPRAQAIKKERDENLGRDSPQSFCLPLGVLQTDIFTFAWRIVHTPKYMVSISEGDTPGYRQFWLDGRGHPKDFGPTWTGHSIGHWEGDTLVVDTVGFNSRGWLPERIPQTEKTHIIERYRRPDLGHLEIEFTVEDPDTFVKPWVFKRAADLTPNDDVTENICTENERDRRHMVGK